MRIDIFFLISSEAYRRQSCLNLQISIKTICLMGTILLLFCSTLYGSAEVEDFTVAIKAFEDGMYDLSKQQFTAFIERYPRSKYSGEALFFLGEINFINKNYAQGESYFKRFVNRYPGHSRQEESLYRLGKCQFIQKKYEQAASTYASISRTYPQSKLLGTAWYWAGESYYQLGKHEQAIQSFSDSLKREEQNKFLIFSRFRRGICYFNTKDYPKALSDLRQVLAENADEEMKTEAAFIICKSLFLNQQYQQFLDENEDLVSYLSPELKADCSLMKANAYIYLQDYRTAISFLSSLIEKSTANNDKHKADYFYLLGTAHLLAKNFEKGIDSFTRIYEEYGSSPKAEESLLNLAYLSMKIGQMQESETYYQNYLKTYPKGRYLLKAYEGLGKLYSNKNDFENAVIYYQKSLQSAPQSDKKYYQYLIASTYQSAGNFEKAIELYQELRSGEDGQDHYTEQASFQQGICYYYAGDYEQAVSHLKNFLISFPESERVNQVRYWLAEAATKINDFDTAIIAFREFIKYENEPILTMKIKEKIAYMLYRQNKFEEAAALYSQLKDHMKTAEKRSWLLYQLGSAYMRINRKNDAAAIFTEFLEQYPEHSLKTEVSFILAQLNISLGKGKDAQKALSLLASEDLSSENKWLLTYYSAQAAEVEKDTTQALKLYQELLESPVITIEKKASILLHIGRIELKRKAIEDAYNRLIALIREAPDSPEAKEGLQLFLSHAESEHDTESARLVLEIASNAPGKISYDAYYRLALFHFEQEDFDQSERYLQDLLALQDIDQDLRILTTIRLAVLLEQKHDYAKVRELLDYILTNTEKDEFREFAIERLDQLPSEADKGNLNDVKLEPERQENSVTLPVMTVETDEEKSDD